MPNVLLRPYLLGFKNTILGKVKNNNPWQKHLPILLISFVIIAVIFFFTHSFLRRLQDDTAVAFEVITDFTDIGLSAFFFLLLFSNVVTTLGFFFCSKDLPLLLTLPIGPLRFYLARLVITCCNASWVLIFFASPVILAYYFALELSGAFLVTVGLVGVPFLIIPSAISSAIVAVFVNISPINRLQGLVMLVPFVVIAVFFATTPDVSTDFLGHETTLEDSLEALTKLSHMTPSWLPSRWVGELLAASMGKSDVNIVSAAVSLFVAAFVSIAIGYFAFRVLFVRGWTKACKGRRNLKVHNWPVVSDMSRFLFPFNSPLRALFAKEGRMFLRDPTQCVQLCLLLTLSIVYLYNLRTLRSISLSHSETYAWWQTVLCISNVALGGVVLAAIATRFVFPTISLEGQAYWIVRSAPMTVHQLLLNKFIIWLTPLTIVAIVLIISGAWAIQVPSGTVMLCAVLSVSISIGLVGLAVGVGAMYATFDWDSPTQASANFGNLVFMLLSMALIIVTLIPSSILIVFASVPGLFSQISRFDYYVEIGCASFLAFYINLATARWALNIGEVALKRREC